LLAPPLRNEVKVECWRTRGWILGVVLKAWIWNINVGARDYFRDELNAGRLRQGWGYLPNLDLRKIAAKIASGQALRPEETATWTRCSPMFSGIDPGDLIAVKNVPDGERFTLVRVRDGGYDYDIGSIGDYGHILPVEVICVFHKRAASVPAPLANALNKERYPIRRTHSHWDTIRRLAELRCDADCQRPEGFKEKVEGWRGALIPRLREGMREKLSPRDTERLVLELLQRDGLQVFDNAGPNERGADILADVSIGYGLSTRLAVQVKMHWDTDNDQTGIDQLEKAIATHNASAGLLVTMASHLGPNLLDRIELSKKSFNIEVLYGDDLFSRLLGLVADADLKIE